MHKKFSRIVPPVLLVVVVGVLAVRLALAAAERASAYQLFDPVVDVQHLLSRHFVRPLGPEELEAMRLGAIGGMIEALNDPYTQFIPAANIADFDKDVRGEYAGIGAEVNTRDGWLWIATPMEDSPAYRAGVEADDLIVAADGEALWNMSVDDSVRRLTGRPGTTVRLTVERKGTDQDAPQGALPASVPDAQGEAPGPRAGNIRFDLEITRERIVTQTVKGVHRVDDRWDFMTDPVNRIGYVRVTQFTGGTVPELKAALQRLVAEGMRGLILDLRFNGGGSLLAATQMADLFMREGLIVSTRGRGDEESIYARGDGTLPDFPMVVMINGQSASASEIVAGALAENGRAVVLGTRSFGKGLVQSLYRLPSGAGQLKVTEQYYYLPSGRCLQRTDDATEWGVDPSPGMRVEMSTEEYRTMIRVRREQEIIRGVRNGTPADSGADWSDPEWVLDHLKDKQLAAAVRAIRGKLNGTGWPVVGEEATPEALQLSAYRTEERRYELLLRELERSQRRLAALDDPSLARTDEEAALVPPGKDLTGGTLRVVDAEGEEVAVLSITGPDLARWLDGAPLEKSTTAGAGEPEPR